MKNYYGKYFPNPLFEREDYELLTGEWDFAFSSETEIPVFNKKIEVPFTYESKASGIGNESVCNHVYYRRRINIKKHSGKIYLCFEGVDYLCEVFLNAKFVGKHRGGYTPFKIDITDTVIVGENDLVVDVRDDLKGDHLCGKQRRRSENYDCWYIQTTGIWKPVWIEYCGSDILENFFIKTKNNGSVIISGKSENRLKAEIFSKGKIVAEKTTNVVNGEFNFEFEIENPDIWSAENPFLYDVRFTVLGEIKDVVKSYFGFREIERDENGIYINGRKVFLKMILDQGYWDETRLSAPDDDAIERDILLTKEMGFNGIRMHQKIENAVFYYLCDKLGVYVWGEIPSAYEYCEKMKNEFIHDCDEITDNLSGHPSIIAWVVFNESWGIPQIKNNKECQDFVSRVGKLVKEKNDGRLMIINDGWHQLDGDVLSLHEYEQNAELLKKEYNNKNYVITDKIINENKWGHAFADGFSYSGQPIIISEYGGVSLASMDGWGYGEKAKDVEEWLNRIEELTAVLESLPYLAGYCYTQLTDVQQETNGLLTIDRKPKADMKRIKHIFGKKK